jgi:hypothetical protein
MGNYRVLAPVGFVSGGEGVTCQRVGAIFELRDEDAKPLVDAGKLEPVKESKAKSETKSGEK